jgi:carboxylate-amine ligase
MCTRVEDTVTIAALYQAILAFLYHLRANNQSWRRYRRIFLAENKWRAQRYGVNGSLADLGRRTLVPLSELIEELLGLLAEHAEKRGCLREIERARTILENGTSADQQLRIYKAALADGADEREAQVRVVDWLIEASLEGVSG